MEKKNELSKERKKNGALMFPPPPSPQTPTPTHTYTYLMTSVPHQERQLLPASITLTEISLLQCRTLLSKTVKCYPVIRSAQIKIQKRRGRGIRIWIRMIYSFRPLPLMKGCEWMTYHLRVHTIIVPMSKKTIKLTTMYLTPY